MDIDITEKAQKKIFKEIKKSKFEDPVVKIIIAGHG